MKILMIDDCKSPKLFVDNPVDVTLAKTFQKGIDYLKSESWDLLLLDHDLGCLNNKHDCPPPDKICLRFSPDCEQPSGMDVMNWLGENIEHLPKQIKCISWNPTGRINIEKAIKNLYD